MQGASATIGVPEAAVRALEAGNDLLCLGGELVKSPDHVAHELVLATVDAIVNAVHTGRLTEERLVEAAARNAPLGTLPASPAQPEPRIELGLSAARRALRVEGAPRPGYVVQLEPPATVAVGEVPWGLAPHLPGVLRLSATVDDAATAVDRILDRAGAQPVVVVSRDTHRHPWARELVHQLAARHAAVTLVEMGWPSSWRPPGLVSYVASYGAAAANGRAVAELIGPVSHTGQA